LGYELHIELKGPDGRSAISEDAWRDAVDRTDGIRLITTADVSAKNPTTGEVITFRTDPLDVEVQFEDGDWAPAVRWNQGRGSLKFTESLFVSTNPVRIAIIRLADALGGSLVGDEGEEYSWSL
jgi:hypothetical protein